VFQPQHLCRTLCSARIGCAAAERICLIETDRTGRSGWPGTSASNEPWIETVREKRFHLSITRFLDTIERCRRYVLIAVNPFSFVRAALFAATTHAVSLDHDDYDLALAARLWAEKSSMTDLRRPASVRLSFLLTTRSTRPTHSRSRPRPCRKIRGTCCRIAA